MTDENTNAKTPTRKVIVSEFLSLDGVMQAPGDPEEDTEGGFAHGGWQMSYSDDVLVNAVSEGIAAANAFLLGRKTYEIFAAYWPSASDEEGFADTMNRMSKFVASETLDEVAWQNSTLMQHDLVDEYHLMIHPLILGSGKRLFRNVSDTAAFRLVDTETTRTGVVILTYQPEKKA